MCRKCKEKKSKTKQNISEEIRLKNIDKQGIISLKK